MSGAVLIRTEGAVRVLVNSNPAARNAIRPELYDALPAALADAAADPAIGAVNRLTEPGAALAEALVLAARVAAGPANASARIRVLCQNAGAATPDEQLDLEAQLMVQSQGDDEAQEGIAAFFGKRLPDFASLRRAAGAAQE